VKAAWRVFRACFVPKETLEGPFPLQVGTRLYQFLKLRTGQRLSMCTAFPIGDEQHGLLLCIEVFRSELEFAMENSRDELITLLKEHGHYPRSDLDREPVV